MAAGVARTTAGPAAAARLTRRGALRSALFGATALGMAAARRAAAQDATPRAGADPLPSWADGPLKTGILAFVAAATDPGNPAFIPPAQRIATFDNDGTLMCEYPAPVQAFFAVDLTRQIGEADPEAARAPVFRRVLSGEYDDLTGAYPAGFSDVFNAVNGDMTQQRFIAFARAWFNRAVHPVTGMRFIDMVYQPQLELLDLLTANGFVPFVVSAGNVDVVRAFAPVVYGIPTWQLVGTSYDYEFAAADGQGQVMGTIDDARVISSANKATAIALQVGQRPVVAVGNSDSDTEMLEYAKGGPTPALTLLVHHTDGDREFAYDRDYAWSPFAAALDNAGTDGFTLIDMKSDWRAIWRETPSPSLLTGG
ncbi:MAG: HAD family hydrolase [Chloroflexota bacterium]